MSYIRIFKYVGIALVLFSLTIGFMLDCNYFYTNDVEKPVFISFCSFLLGMAFLCYADEKLK
jgi:hypothetical protein